ncbi:MAG: hypothetical protein IJE84_02620 [Clostridia bacterium]|nr:hypothetical protein [Clostridia bacterium]
MNKIALRLVCFLLLLSISFCTISCGAQKDYIYKNDTKDYVYKYGDFVIDKNFYTYWLARYKAVLMYTYSDIKDTDEYWDTDHGSGSANDVLTSYADQTIMNYLASVYLFNKFALALSSSKVESVDKQLSEIVDDGYDGDVSALNAEAYQFGINYDMLRQIYMAEAKTEVVYSYLTSTVFSDKLTDELREKYLSENYAHTTHIFVATEYSYNIDKDGNIIYDSDGNYTTELTDAEKAEQKKKIEKLDSLSITRENFSEYQNEYNEDPAVSMYKNGFFVSSSNNYDAAYVTAALTMSPGEVKKVEGSEGVYYILKEEMPEGAYSNKDNSDFFDKYDSKILDYLYWQYMEQIYKDISINEEVKKGISVKSVSPCWYF